MKRLFWLVAGSLAVQAAVAGAKAPTRAPARKALPPNGAAKAAPAAPPEATGPLPLAAVLPSGKGPIAAGRLAGVNWKASTPPAFLRELRMPAAPVLTSDAKPTGKMAAKPSETAAAVAEVDAAIAREIRNSGIVQPLAALGKKYDENKLVDLFTRGLKASFNPAAGPPTAAVAPAGRRMLGWWDDLWDAVEDFVTDVGCGAFAAGALPGYLLAYSLFHAKNSGYEQLSTHQKFFQRAAFSSDLLGKVNVKYSAWLAPGFGSAAGVTMGSEIYIKGPKQNLDSLPFWNMTISPAFASQTRLLMHELGHSKQYAARNWNVADFGFDYLFRFCEAGMSYSGNSMEKDASTYENDAEGILTGPARAHFKKWRKDNLYFSTGYSKNAAEYSNFKIGTTRIMSIDLTKTIAKVAESQRKEGTHCVRVLWGSTLASRTLAEIAGKKWDCVNMKPTPAPTKKPTTRAPTTRTPIILGIPAGTPQLSPTRAPTTRAPTVKIPL